MVLFKSIFNKYYIIQIIKELKSYLNTKREVTLSILLDNKNTTEKIMLIDKIFS